MFVIYSICLDNLQVRLYDYCHTQDAVNTLLDTVARQFIRHEDGERRSEDPYRDTVTDNAITEDGHFLRHSAAGNQIDVFLRQTKVHQGWTGKYAEVSCKRIMYFSVTEASLGLPIEKPVNVTNTITKPNLSSLKQVQNAAHLDELKERVAKRRIIVDEAEMLGVPPSPPRIRVRVWPQRSLEAASHAQVLHRRLAEIRQQLEPETELEVYPESVNESKVIVEEKNKETEVKADDDNSSDTELMVNIDTLKDSTDNEIPIHHRKYILAKIRENNMLEGKLAKEAVSYELYQYIMNNYEEITNENFRRTTFLKAKELLSNAETEPLVKLLHEYVEMVKAEESHSSHSYSELICNEESLNSDSEYSHEYEYEYYDYDEYDDEYDECNENKEETIEQDAVDTESSSSYNSRFSSSSESSSDTESDTSSETSSDTESDTSSETSSETESDTSSETSSETESETISETESETSSSFTFSSSDNNEHITNDIDIDQLENFIQQTLEQAYNDIDEMDSIVNRTRIESKHNDLSDESFELINQRRASTGSIDFPEPRPLSPLPHSPLRPLPPLPLPPPLPPLPEFLTDFRKKLD